eukprot:1139984-Pelagomonas_calceolata.AAC.2
MMAVDPPKKRGRPPKIPSPQIGEDDIAAGLKGKAVLVPSSALAALASVHGRDTYLHGKIKVISGMGPPSPGYCLVPAAQRPNFPQGSDPLPLPPPKTCTQQFLRLLEPKPFIPRTCHMFSRRAF